MDKLPSELYLFEDRNGKWIDFGYETISFDLADAVERLGRLHSDGDSMELVDELKPAKIVCYKRAIIQRDDEGGKEEGN